MKRPALLDYFAKQQVRDFAVLLIISTHTSTDIVYHQSISLVVDILQHTEQNAAVRAFDQPRLIFTSDAMIPQSGALYKVLREHLDKCSRGGTCAVTSSTLSGDGCRSFKAALGLSDEDLQSVSTAYISKLCPPGKDQLSGKPNQVAAWNQLAHIPKIIETVRAELHLGDGAVAELRKRLINYAVQRDRKQTFSPESANLVADLTAAGLVATDSPVDSEDVTESMEPAPKKQKV